MNKNLNQFLRAMQLCSILALALFITTTCRLRLLRTQKTPVSHPPRLSRWRAESNLPVVGGGTIGRLTKWTGFASNSVIGDTTIFEDKFFKVGVGTDTPTSKLTVAGMIEIRWRGIEISRRHICRRLPSIRIKWSESERADWRFAACGGKTSRLRLLATR